MRSPPESQASVAAFRIPQRESGLLQGGWLRLWLWIVITLSLLWPRAGGAAEPRDPGAGRATTGNAAQIPGNEAMRDRYATAVALSEREKPVPGKAGRVARERLVRDAGSKYPLLRVEEEFDTSKGERRLVRQTAAIADHVMVKLRPGVTEQRLLEELKGMGAKIRKRLPLSQILLVSFPQPDLDTVSRALQVVTGTPGLTDYAEPDYLIHVDATPNDTRFGDLWGLHNTGQSSGTADADCDAPEAWNLSTGSVSVKVAVIDTGIDYNHPDLAANIWSNPGEIPENGIDDDANGYIDDTRGWDFLNDDNDPMDDNGHGTHCAGTIGAMGNNGSGVAGVCWRVSLVPLKFLPASGSGPISGALEAVTYSTRMGVTLTSNSYSLELGGGAPPSFRDAIEAANAAGILFVAAAGNDYGNNNDTLPSIPSSYSSPNILSVAATDRNDQLAGFSNIGPMSVDLGAPGVFILSTKPANDYQYLSGTSMAAPHVAGACALLKAYRPNLSHLAIRDLVLASVDPVPSLAGKTLTGGRLNVHKALVMAAATANSEIAVEQPAGNGLTDGAAAPVTFDDVPVQGSSVRTFTIVNSGTEMLVGLNITKDGSESSNFVVGPLAVTALAPGASTTFNVTFTPSAGGLRNAAIHIESSDVDEGPFDINLAASGLVPEIVVEQPAGSGLTDGSLSPVAFDDVLVGSSSARTFTIINSGAASLTGLSISKNGSHNTNFVVSALAATTLAPGSSTNFTVTFTPSASGLRTAAIHIANSDADENPFDINLAGNGLVPEIAVEQPAGTNLTDNTGSKSFGNVLVGATSSLTFTIRNLGTGLLTDLATTKNGTHAADFTVDSLQTSSLAAGESTTFSVTFAPSAAGTRTAAIHIASSDANENPFDINLSGVGQAPEIAVEQPSGTGRTDGSATPVSFGNVLMGGTANLTFVIRNTGSATLNGVGVAKDGADSADFTIGALGAATLAPGTSTTFTVTFVPGAVGTRSAAIHIASNDADENPFDLFLTGVGAVPEIVVEQPAGTGLTDGSATPVDYGDVLFGTNSIRTFTIRNTGTGNLTGLSVTKNGTDSANFTVGSLGATTLAPNASTTFNVTFTPSAAGLRTAAIHIASSDTDENPFDINLAGNCIVPNIAVEQPVGNNLTDNGAAVSFGSVVVGQTASLVFTIRNTGPGNLTGLTLSEAGGFPGDYSAAPPSVTTLATGEITTFSVTFAPAAAGIRTVILRIASNDPNENPFDINLTGTGLAPEIAVEQPTGTSLIDGSATPRSFGNVNLGSTAALTFTVRNTGTANLTGLGITHNGTHQADYLLGSLSTSILAPGASTTFTVTFAPSSPGTRTAALHLASNDANENPFDINLTGTGLGPNIAIEQPAGTNLVDGVSSVNWGELLAGTASTRTFTVKNTGTLNLTGLIATVSGPNAAEFAAGALSVTTLAPNTSTTFTLTFTPQAAGVHTALLQIASNDPNENPFDLTLVGNGLTRREHWRLTNFGSSANSASGADANDFDFDGLSNLLEFALNTDPKIRSNLPYSWSIEGNSLAFTYTRATAALADGIGFSVQWNDSLEPLSWAGTGVVETIIGGAAGAEQVKATMPAGTTGKRFIQLKVTAP